MSDAALSSEQLLHQLNWRYATKSFDTSKKVPDALWETLEQSLRLAPSSFGLQPWKFIVVADPEVRQKIQAHAWGQVQVVEASHLVVLARKLEVQPADVDHYLESMASIRGATLESLEGFGNMVKGFLASPPFPLDPKEWTARQTYIALGQFMTSAAMLGIDTCPMEGFVPSGVDEVLGLTAQGYGAVVLCPTGYRSADDKYATLAKVRFPKAELFEYI